MQENIIRDSIEELWYTGSRHQALLLTRALLELGTLELNTIRRTLLYFRRETLDSALISEITDILTGFAS